MNTRKLRWRGILEAMRKSLREGNEIQGAPFQLWLTVNHMNWVRFDRTVWRRSLARKGIRS